MSDPLRIAIDAELEPGAQAGGTQSVLTGLVKALGELQSSGEEYLLVSHPENRGWLEKIAGPNTRIVPRPRLRLGWTSRIRHQLVDVLGLRPQWPELPLSDGFYESLGADVVHFPFQRFTLCARPAVFNPHDLLHRHLPHFLRPVDIAHRESTYSGACRMAHTVVAGSQWVKDDLVKTYSLSPEKVQVIPWAPPTHAAAIAEQVVARYEITTPFALYPAVTWEHKNHLRLLQAVADLRNQGIVIQLICTGHRFPNHWPKVETEISRLNLAGQVRFLEEIPFADLRGLYRAAQFVVVPTLFEAASGPVFEAWHEGTPVACSTITSLPEQAGNAALLFDPYQVEQIADAMKRLSQDEPLRNTLREEGRRRLTDFSWERTARAYRAVYRRAAKRSLTAEDVDLLGWDWMRHPRR